MNLKDRAAQPHTLRLMETPGQDVHVHAGNRALGSVSPKLSVDPEDSLTPRSGLANDD